MTLDRIFLSTVLFLCSSCWAAEAVDKKTVNATTLVSEDYYTARRHQRYFVVELQVPHQVLTTSSINGGMTETLAYLVNYQSMEARSGLKHVRSITEKTKQQYHDSVADEIGIAPAKMAMMGTAANMNNLIHIRKSFEGLHIDSFVTAGVRGNALRAGDPTSWYETAEGNRKIDVSGTINTVLMINQPLTAGAQSKAAMLMVEAKSAALAELMVSSTVSSHLATGTGTDQFIIATPIATNKRALESASGHLKLGELIGSAVREATLEAIRWQNRLEHTDAADLVYLLKRFGFTQTLFLARLEKYLTAEQYELAKNNHYSLTADARVVAATMGYVQLLDRFQYHNLPVTLRTEALRDQAAQIAMALAGKPDQWHRYWQQLSLNDAVEQPEIELLIQAVALGWTDKWPSE